MKKERILTSPNQREKLLSIAGDGNVRFDEKLAEHTTFRVGGPADAWVAVQSVRQLTELLGWAQSAAIPCFFMGRGSNLVVSDEGYRGIVLCPGEGLSLVRIANTKVTAGCGASLAKIAHAALDASLNGFAFAAGIPGSLGGAVYMNAGAYGGEMKQVLETITFLDGTGLHTMTADQAELSYRHSRFMDTAGIILEAELRLEPGDPDAIRTEMQDLAERRRSKQPLEYPSAGSMFKRPEGYFAGKLIQDCGLAGYAVGGAAVSEKHCGFVINRGGACARDIRELVRQVHEKVYASFGVEIWPEVRYLDEDGLKSLL